MPWEEIRGLSVSFLHARHYFSFGVTWPGVVEREKPEVKIKTVGAPCFLLLRAVEDLGLHLGHVSRHLNAEIKKESTRLSV